MTQHAQAPALLKDISATEGTVTILVNNAGVHLKKPAEDITFERILAVLVALMGVSFLLAAVVSFPGWTALVSGLIPRVPAVAEGSDNSAFVIIAGMFYLTSRKDLMGEYRTKGAEWVPQVLLLGFACYVSSLAIRGLIADIASL